MGPLPFPRGEDQDILKTVLSQESRHTVCVQSLAFIGMLSEKLESGYWPSVHDSVPCSIFVSTCDSVYCYLLSQKSSHKDLNLLDRHCKAVASLSEICSCLFSVLSQKSSHSLHTQVFKVIVAHSEKLRGFLHPVHTSHPAVECH